jgi:hypothetical protein
MTPERAAALVTRWARLYTRDVPGPIAQRRLEELSADVQDHIAYERSRGTSDSRIATGVLSRMVRGMAADLSWRRHTKISKGESMKPLIALLVAGLALAAAAFVADSPLILLVSVAAMGLVILGAFVMGVRAAQERGFTVPYLGVLAGGLGLGALATAAIVVGSRDDAPGLVLLGIVLITAAVTGVLAVGLRSAQRTNEG